jgi:DNA-binding transcriptional LysR family regulator
VDIKRLRIFLAVAQSGSFTRAADRVHLSQSAVSQQMALLEAETREALFERGARGVRLTRAGTELAAQAQRVVDEMQRLEMLVDRLGNGVRELRIGAFPSAGIELLPKALKAFRARGLDVRVMLSTVNPEGAVRALEAGDVHAVLLFDYSHRPRELGSRVDRLHLLDDALLAVLPITHPAASRQADLGRERWIFHRPFAPYQHVYPDICRLAGFEPDVLFYAEDVQTIRGLVAEEMCVSIAPRLSALPDGDGLALRPISTPAIVRRISVLTLPAAKDATVAAFVEDLRAAAGQLPQH